MKGDRNDRTSKKRSSMPKHLSRTKASRPLVSLHMRIVQITKWGGGCKYLCQRGMAGGERTPLVESDEHVDYGIKSVSVMSEDGGHPDSPSPRGE